MDQPALDDTMVKGDIQLFAEHVGYGGAAHMELACDMIQGKLFTQMGINIFENIIKQAPGFRFGNGGIAVIKGAADMYH